MEYLNELKAPVTMEVSSMEGMSASPLELTSRIEKTLFGSSILLSSEAKLMF